MTQTPRKGTLGVKVQNSFWGSMPQTSLEAGNQLVFILDLHLRRTVINAAHQKRFFIVIKMTSWACTC